jgi:hypothetical protein
MQFQKDTGIRGMTPKIINEIFIEGFTPPVFKSFVKKIGSTDIHTTIAYLPILYTELEIHLRWKN